MCGIILQIILLLFADICNSGFTGWLGGVVASNKDVGVPRALWVWCLSSIYTTNPLPTVLMLCNIPHDTKCTVEYHTIQYHITALPWSTIHSLIVILDLHNHSHCPSAMYHTKPTNKLKDVRYALHTITEHTIPCYAILYNTQSDLHNHPHCPPASLPYNWRRLFFIGEL